MTLLLATLLTGLFLAALGAALLSGHSAVTSVIKGFPRSRTATALLFGGATVWFLYRVLNLSEADFGEYRHLIFILFGAAAALAFHYVPDFLAVRGAAGLVLLAASPLLEAAFMEWEHPQRLLMVSIVYLFIFASIWLGAQPWRMRDFLEWLYKAPGRTRGLGGLLLGYGLLLCGIAFTY